LKSLWRPLLGVGILAGFIAFIEVYFGWPKLLAPWLLVPVGQIAVAAVLILISYWLRAVRFYDYFRTEMAGRFALCIKLMLQHNLLNNILPMRTGELSFPVLMTRYFSVPALRSIPALLWFRAMDLHTLGFFGVLAVPSAAWPWPLATIALALWLPLPWLSFHFSSRWRHALQRHDQKPAYRLLSRVLQGLPQAPAAFWRAWGWTALNWVFKLGAFVWVLRLFIPISLPAAWMGSIAGDLTSVLPVHGLAGAGTYEAGVVAGLLPYGVAAQPALAAAVNLHLFLLGTTLVGGAISLFIGGPRHG
jgi:glycosyltransferase 2 family protein